MDSTTSLVKLGPGNPVVVEILAKNRDRIEQDLIALLSKSSKDGTLDHQTIR